LFVLAHPDDETVFFTPTVHAMREQSNLHILVLSNGGYDGLGKIREKEMEKAAEYLGFKDFKVVDDKEILDGP
jgi:N-acetylglucosaminylphosphatidylinositol deacetylase